jgi:hypothetical protein
MQGYGTPLAIYGVYALKIALYVGGWVAFCTRTTSLGPASEIAAWWSRPEAFEKAIVWSMLFELLGLGCGSGPLTGRYMPPIGGVLYFLRPKTTKLPLLRVPVLGGTRRTVVDVALYAAILALLAAILAGRSVDRSLVIGIVVLLPIATLFDKTLFLCARGEHYWTTLVVVVLMPDFIPGAMAIQAALWFGAGFSKLNPHFPYVVGVMTSNSPLLRWPAIRRRMYRRFPDDLSPSTTATWLGHGGTLLELAVPVVLVASHGGTGTLVGLALMVLLHGYITSNVPAGVPLEWNVMMVYGGFFLFGAHAAESVRALSLPMACVLFVPCVAIPIAGNLWPSKIPFLLAMRYYAGNWAYSVWLFKGKSHDKLGRLTKSSRWVYEQLAAFYDLPTSIGLVSKVMAFRLMHLHGRALCELVPKAVGDGEGYEWIDGEIVAGLALGWNFGDGHLHGEELLSALQEQCSFDEGELRCVMVESQPLGDPRLAYRIHDAKTGLLERGHVRVEDLRRRQPWDFAAPEPNVVARDTP